MKALFPKKHLLILWIATVAVFMLAIYQSIQGNFPYVFNDEFGYWGSAAWMAGYDWSNVYSLIPYYSFGYSPVLWLMIKIMPAMTAAYKAAVLVNGIWVAGSIWLLYCLAKKICFTSNMKAACCAIVAGLFASNLAQIRYTWPETFLFFYFCLLSMVIVFLFEKDRVWLSGVLGILAASSYYVHQRTLGIVFAAVMTVLYLFWDKKLSKKSLLTFCGLFVLTFLLLHLVKDQVLDNVWVRSPMSAVNNMASQAGNIALFFTPEGFLRFLISLGGKLFYVFQSTYLLVPYAFCCLCWHIYAAWKRPGVKAVLSLFLVLSMIASLGINSLGMLFPGNVSHAIYGRYIDNLFGPFLLIALVTLVDKNVNWKLFLSIAVIYILLLFHAKFMMGQVITWHHDVINVSGMGNLVDDTGIYLKISLLETAFVWIVAIIAIKPLFLLVVLAMFGYTGYKTASKFAGNWAYSTRSTEAVVSILEQNQDEPFYILKENDGAYPEQYLGDALQFLLPETRFEILYGEELEKLPDEGLILTATSKNRFSEIVPILETESVTVFDLEDLK